MPAEMSTCHHCGVRVMRLDYPDGPAWLHMNNMVLVREYQGCISPEPTVRPS